MAAPQQFSLRWNNYSQHIVTALEDLRSDDELVDVTLSCEGQRIRCHKVLLSACSTYFRETFKDNPCKHPTIIIKGVSFLDLEAVVTFMYNGQVNVSQDRLPTFLSAAEYLQIKGLTDMNDKEEPAAKKRTLPNHNLSNANAPGASRSGSGTSTPDNVQRPPSPKRKRMIPGESLNMKSMAQPTPNPANEPKSQNENGPSNNNNDHDHHSHDPFAPDVSIKYEDGDDDDATGLSVEDHDGSQDDMMMEGSGMGFGSSSGAGLGASGNDSSHGSYDKRRVRQPQNHISASSEEPAAAAPGIMAGSSLLDQLEIVGVDEEDEEPESQNGNNGYKYNNGDDDNEEDDDYYEQEYHQGAGAAHHGSNLYSVVTAAAATSASPLSSLKININQQNRSSAPPQLYQLPVLKSISSVALSRNLDAPFVCDICGKGYVHSCTLAQHKKLHEGQTKCKLCSQTLSNVSNLRQHYQTIHGFSSADVQGKSVFEISPGSNLSRWQ